MNSAGSAPTLDLAVLLVFWARPRTLARCFGRIREARPARLYLFQDGPPADAERAAAWAAEVPSLAENLRQATEATSRHAKYLDCRAETAGRLLFLRFAFSTGEASGHNMATKAAAAALQWLLAHWEGAEYVSESGNFCCDKKTSAVNGILGRGNPANVGSGEFISDDGSPAARAEFNHIYTPLGETADAARNGKFFGGIAHLFDRFYDIGLARRTLDRH